MQVNFKNLRRKIFSVNPEKQSTMKSYIMALSLISSFLLTACNNNNSTPPYGDLITVRAVLTGQVSSNGSGVSGAKVYLNEKGFDCNKPTLADPTRFDSTLTNEQGQFTIETTFLNTVKPICIEAFAISQEGDDLLSSDTIQVTTPLKREPPFDTTFVNLVY